MIFDGLFFKISVSVRIQIIGLSSESFVIKCEKEICSNRKLVGKQGYWFNKCQIIKGRLYMLQ